MLLKPLDDADVGQAEGAAALESQADGGTVGRDNGRQGGWRWGWERGGLLSWLLGWLRPQFLAGGSGCEEDEGDQDGGTIARHNQTL
jgi:hypothetical protein